MLAFSNIYGRYTNLDYGNSILLPDHYSTIFDALDYQNKNSLCLIQIYTFCCLFYRHDTNFHSKIFYRKLRFHYYYYLERSWLKLEEIDESIIIPDQDSHKEFRKIYYDKRLDVFSITRNQFFNICTDMSILGKEETFKGTKLLMNRISKNI